MRPSRAADRVQRYVNDGLDAAAERALVVLTGARHRRVTARLIEDVIKAIKGKDGDSNDDLVP